MAGNEDVIAAIESGNANQLKELLAADRSLGAAHDASGVSALMQALYRQRKDMVEMLRMARPDLDIFEAASLGRPDLVEDMVTQNPRLSNARSGDGFTPLHFAAFFGEESVARVLLEHHADAGAVANNPMQVMPLHSAAAARNLAIARALLEHGAPVNARQQKGWTALHAAAQHGDQAMVELLLKYGANPNAKNDEGRTPDEVADEKGHVDIAERLRAA
ncbi:MAG TPA: ankyrin repeat domain-containing protein [Terriglobales bacterium]|nr:ankyrin repeat domain-containing protein [Terriglobales bacterium]